MIDGVTSAPFSASTLPQIERPIVSHAKEIIESSRATYARPRMAVEDDIKAWHAPVLPEALKNKPTSAAPEAPKKQQEKQQAPAASHVSHVISSPKPVVSNNPAPAASKEHQPFKQLLTPEVLSKQKKDQQEQRETDLRKVMSLDYLRPQPKQSQQSHAVSKEETDARECRRAQSRII